MYFIDQDYNLTNLKDIYTYNIYKHTHTHIFIDTT